MEPSVWFHVYTRSADHSDRRVTIGSTRVARYAGTSVAAIPTASISRATAENVPGSC